MAIFNSYVDITRGYIYGCSLWSSRLGNEVFLEATHQWVTYEWDMFFSIGMSQVTGG